MEKWIARLRKAHGKETALRACYEAGPGGFGLARRLRQLGVECEVVAPSMTPPVRATGSRPTNETHANDAQIEQLFARHRDAAIWTSFPGAGSTLAPRLAFGSERSRYPDAVAIQQDTNCQATS
ncbi:MAG: hypothetical protein H0V54_03770 [Chthoniobacterales bacterium]|nr:hypothetical protein [Chthoniobacterales bacterium]